MPRGCRLTAPRPDEKGSDNARPGVGEEKRIGRFCKTIKYIYTDSVHKSPTRLIALQKP